MSHRAFALIHADTDVDLNDITEKLAARLRHMAVVRRGNSIDLSDQGWAVLVDFVADPHVVAESQEIADTFGEGRPDLAQIALCRTRFEVTADPDPNMGHFHDYATALDVLYNLGNVVLFDPERGAFI